MVKNPPANAGDTGLIPGSGRSPGGGNGNPLQYSCLENLMDRGVVGYSPWCRKESNTAEQLHFLFSFLNFKIEKYVVFFLLSGQSPASSIILLLWSFYY